MDVIGYCLSSWIPHKIIAGCHADLPLRHYLRRTRNIVPSRVMATVAGEVSCDFTRRLGISLHMAPHHSLPRNLSQGMDGNGVAWLV